MKTLKIVICQLLCLIPGLTKADIIIVSTKSIPFCATIENLDSFPDISIILSSSLSTTFYVEVTQNACIDKGYKYNTSNLYAVDKSILKTKGKENINYSNNSEALKCNINIPAVLNYFVEKTSPIESITESYSILGLTDTSFIVYKKQERFKFSNGAADSIVNHTIPENANLKKNFTDVHSLIDKPKLCLIFPNPSQDILNFQILSQVMNKVSIEITNVKGQKFHAEEFSKTNELLKKQIDIAQLSSGFYILKFKTGNYSESRLFLKK